METKCPYTRKLCMREKCELWDFYPVTETGQLTGQAVVKEVGMCTHSWQTKIAFDNASFNDYFGKSLDKLRSETVKRQDALLELAAPKVRRINGD